jgi:DNA-binding NtrC family response regulator
MNQPVILIFGRDSTLLETRGWLLERTGALVLTATSLTETKEIAAKHSISLLVICHSVSPEDCEQLLLAIEQLQPNVKKLLMTANTSLSPLGQGERTLSAFEGPAALLGTVRALLGVEPGVAESR